MEINNLSGRTFADVASFLKVQPNAWFKIHNLCRNWDWENPKHVSTCTWSEGWEEMQNSRYRSVHCIKKKNITHRRSFINFYYRLLGSRTTYICMETVLAWDTWGILSECLLTGGGKNIYFSFFTYTLTFLQSVNPVSKGAFDVPWQSKSFYFTISRKFSIHFCKATVFGT